ncbi:Optic atrophy 3 protein [Gamsiella multidivaricata]|nr:Optic atrophy 3 protein [Gamsiella multidivaricata]
MHFSHKTEMQLKMKFLGYKVESIRPLNDARAVEMGANFLGEAIIFGVAGTRMNARDRKNHVDDTLDNLLLITSELREEIKELSVATEQRVEELQRENQVLRKTLNEILDVSLRLRNHTPYSGQEIGIGNAKGGFVLQIADEPMVRPFPVDPAPQSSPTTLSNSSSGQDNASETSVYSSKPSLQSSYDFHHEHHQLGHSQPEEDFILIEQQTSLPSQHVKKSRWESMTAPWFSSGSSGSSSSSSSSSSA